MGKIKVVPVVIDTNVVVSALLFGGVPGEIAVLWKTGIIRPKASKEILDEYIRVLAYPKFDLTEEEINFLLYQEILAYFDVLKVKSRERIVKDDPSDDKFIRCAQAVKARIIISGDQHLLKLKSYGKIKILTPAQFLQKI
jgi:putative PIN family toxin of toxin-antitoxin system